jgi:hypothetical protein
MECPTCGEPIRPGSRLCTSCGTWLLDDDQRSNKSAPSFGGAGAPGGAGAVGRAGAPPTGPLPPDPSRWAPPSAAQRVEQPPPAGTGPASGFTPPPSFTAPPTFTAPTFGAPPPYTAQPVFTTPPEPTFTDPLPDDDFYERTTLSTRRGAGAAYWSLSLPNGAVELVTDRPIIIGRQPEFMPALPMARLIPVPDPTRSVSKNHACFSMYGAALVVEDLGSTNGIIVTRPDGRENDLGVGGRTELEAGSKVELGDAVITIGRA